MESKCNEKTHLGGDSRRNAKGLDRRHFLKTAGFAAAMANLPYGAE